jgi:phenylpropionate dioxygenase-like ring-hydroxylating dioxygenase large terminal subunit
MHGTTVTLVDDIDAKLTAGYTFPSRWYWDPAIYRLEVDHIWARSWHYICGTDAIPGGHRLGELSFAVTAGPDGEPVATCNGAPARAEVWRGLVFCNADLEARSFADTYPALERLCREHPFGIGDRVPVPATGMPVAANWKIWVENASECYHCPTIHRESFSDAYEVAHGVYEYINDGPVLCQLTPPNEKAKRFGLAGQEYRYWYLFPSTFLQVDEYYTSAGRVHPTGVESCITDGDSWLQPGLDPALVAEWDEMWRMTMQEDIDAVAIQQPNLRSGLVPHGRLMPSSESAIAHFHRLCFEALRPHLR